MSFVKKFLKTEVPRAELAYLANLDHLLAREPLIGKAILDEYHAQSGSLKMIASENYSSIYVQLAMANLFTDKYAEGFVGHRFYAGCDNVDSIERLAEERAKKIFHMPYAYVQPHSGADANMVAFMAILHKRIEEPFLMHLGLKNANSLGEADFEHLRQKMVNQKLLGMSLDAGGHLTHGSKMNISSKLFRALSYSVDPKTQLLDYKAIEQVAVRERPLVLLAGYSAYPRMIDFSIMREISDKAGATLMVDMAHFAGLVAGGAVTGNYSPVGFADIITSTTHKTLRGPRGGLILSTEEYAPFVQRGCPFILGGPLENIIAAKAVAFHEALSPSFADYAKQIIANAKAFADALLRCGFQLTTGGTDNHLVIVDIAATHRLTGMQGERLLSSAGITVNRNSIPFDVMGPWFTSGIRFGTAALTTRGMKEGEMDTIANIVRDLFGDASGQSDSKSGIRIEESRLAFHRQRIKELLENFPLYATLKLEGVLL
ncbi:MAG: serine hydroxymethyltransferase [Chlamydiae bacterium RIFCSPHIGHO2_12_FULL_49_11]|nr:MAG: serine hydroxymethyltransferase [Chlamydiae bacterium RIFCSPHIGHO2_12_FULL_49_11]